MRMLKTRDDQAIGEAPARPREVRTQTTYIDQGCEVVGEMRFGDGVRIDGHVEGDVRARKTVVIGEEAQVRARIEAEAVVVHGTVEGDICAKNKITLHKTASVTGEIQTAGIVVEEGARLEGCIIIGREAQKAADSQKALDSQNKVDPRKTVDSQQGKPGA